MKLKNNKGVTLISLTVIMVILFMITGAIIYNTKNQIKLRNLDDLYIDISAISAGVDKYYLSYGALPVLCDYLDKDGVINLINKEVESQGAKVSNASILNPNDGDKYYVIDLSKIEALTLNYGYNNDDYNKIRQSGAISSPSNLDAVEDEVYIINELTHQIYFPHGLVLDGVLYYSNEGVWTNFEKLDI